MLKVIGPLFADTPITCAAHMIATGHYQWDQYNRIRSVLPTDDIDRAAKGAIEHLLEDRPVNGAQVAEIIVAFWKHDLNSLKRALNEANAWAKPIHAQLADALIEHVTLCTGCDPSRPTVGLVEEDEAHSFSPLNVDPDPTMN